MPERDFTPRGPAIIPAPMLTIESLQAGYGHTPVLFDVSLSIASGEVVTLLGRNGMGKTTTIRTLMGLLPAAGGSMRFRERDLGSLAAEDRARLGLGLVPEGRQVFPTLSVVENLIATAANRRGVELPWTLRRIWALFPRLEERQHQIASTLSGGEQQMLAIGRALMTNPLLLILDEATEGLAPLIRADIWRCIAELKDAGTGDPDRGQAPSRLAASGGPSRDHRKRAHGLVRRLGGDGRPPGPGAALSGGVNGHRANRAR